MNDEIKKLEALLFTSGKPLSKKKISSILKCKEEDVTEYAKVLSEKRLDSGVNIIDSGSHITLSTSTDVSDFIEEYEKDEQTGELSKAAKETLAIIAYTSPISKTDIDYIRGVNVQYTIRRLAMRGLIYEKKEGRGKVITCTPELLMHLGINNINELPQYEEIHKQIKEGIETTKRRMKE